MKGTILKLEDIFYVDFWETKYTSDGLDYNEIDIVEIHPEDVIELKISDNSVGDEVDFKKQWEIYNGEEFYYVRVIKNESI